MGYELVDEWVRHYVHASKGSKERALLLALDAGYDFKRVVCSLSEEFGGNEGVRVAFQCLLKGWIDSGHITEKGRAFLRSGADA